MTAEFWQYDSRIGRRWNVDPRPTTAESPYLSFHGNPIYFKDILGDSSVFDNKGNKIYYDAKDKDTRVFLRDGDGKLSLIGQLGGNIDLNTILNNKLQDSRSRMVHGQSRGGSRWEWLGAVLPGNHWDLKANTQTIFGVAWKYDNDNKTVLKGRHTSFTAKYGHLNIEFKSSADVGNFHAGYAGMYAKMPISVQKLFAGVGEKLKNAVDAVKGSEDGFNNFFENPVIGRPWGDRKADYFWNTLGMSMADYDMKIQATINPPAPTPTLSVPRSDNATMRKPIMLIPIDFPKK